MKFSDLKNKSERELRELLAEKHDELRELRFKASEKQLKNVKSIRNLRRVIARVSTLLNAREKAKQ